MWEQGKTMADASGTDMGTSAQSVEVPEAVCQATPEITALIARHLPVATKQGWAVLDADRRHLFYNARYLELQCVPRERMRPGLTLDGVISIGAEGEHRAESSWSEGFAFMMEALSREAKAGREARHSMRIPTTQGRTYLARICYTACGHILLALEDVTRQEEARTLLDIAFDTGDAGYWSYDVRENLFQLSRSVRNRLSAAERAQIRNSGLFSLMERDDVPGVMSKWSWALSNPDTDRLDITYRVTTERDGTMWQRSICRLTRDDEGKPLRVTAFVRDITEDVRREKELVAAQESAASKTEFLARMSHEIRTPLNAMIALVDLLQSDDYDLSDEVRDILGSIDSAAEGLHHQLSQTLDHAKLSAGRVELFAEETRPADMVREVAGLWQSSARLKGIELKTEIDSALPDTLTLDGFRIGQCLNNLVGNAIKFTESGEVSLRLARDGDRLAISVRDTGIGMDEAAQARVFAAFEQAEQSTTRRFGGTGLGLSIVDGLVRLMEGDVALESAPGEGSTFTLAIPAPELEAMPEAEPEPAAGVPAPSEDEPFGGLRVLCVEDAALNREVIERLLRPVVGDLQFAEDGVQALDRLDASEFDVILMDIHMPVMDGIETTIAIRNSDKAYANVVIIALTADPDYQHKRICRNLGMDDAISKPVRRREILDAFARSFELVSEIWGQPVEVPGGAVEPAGRVEAA